MQIKYTEEMTAFIRTLLGNPSESARETDIVVNENKENKALIMEDQDDPRVLSAAAHIKENVLNLRCPQCMAVFYDFDACCAVTCRACGISFCGLCMMPPGGKSKKNGNMEGSDTTKEAAHAHVIAVHGRLFMQEEEILRQQNVFRQHRLVHYLVSLAVSPSLPPSLPPSSSLAPSLSTDASLPQDDARLTAPGMDIRAERSEGEAAGEEVRRAAEVGLVGVPYPALMERVLFQVARECNDVGLDVDEIRRKAHEALRGPSEGMAGGEQDREGSTPSEVGREREHNDLLGLGRFHQLRLSSSPVSRREMTHDFAPVRFPVGATQVRPCGPGRGAREVEVEGGRQGGLESTLTGGEVAGREQGLAVSHTRRPSRLHVEELRLEGGREGGKEGG
jgi:hypothetical protein